MPRRPSRPLDTHGDSGISGAQRPVSLPMRYTQPHPALQVHPPLGQRGAAAALPPLVPVPRPAGTREIVEQAALPAAVAGGDGADEGDEEEGKATASGGGNAEDEAEEEDIDVDGIDIHPPPLLQLEPSGGPSMRRSTTHAAAAAAAAGNPEAATMPKAAGPVANGKAEAAGAALAQQQLSPTTAGAGAGLTPHAHLAAPAPPKKVGEDEDELALAGLGIRLNKEGGLLVMDGGRGGGGTTPLSEEARILQHQFHPTRPGHHRGVGPGAGAGAAAVVDVGGYGYGGFGGRGGDGGDYGSFSPSTIPVDDRRPQISARSKAVLEQFFRKPISSEIYGTAFVTVSTLEATAILRQTVTYQRAFEVGAWGCVVGVGGPPCHHGVTPAIMLWVCERATHHR